MRALKATLLNRRPTSLVGVPLTIDGMLPTEVMKKRFAQ